MKEICGATGLPCTKCNPGACYSRQKLQPQPTVSDVIEEVKAEFCINFCKYTEECEKRLDNNEDLRECPIDRL